MWCEKKSGCKGVVKKAQHCCRLPGGLRATLDWRKHGWGNKVVIISFERTNVRRYSIVGPLNFLVLQVKKSLKAKLNADKREAWGDESGVGHQDVGGAKEGEFQVFYFLSCTFLEAAFYFVYLLLLYWQYNEILTKPNILGDFFAYVSKRKTQSSIHIEHRTAKRIIFILFKVSSQRIGQNIPKRQESWPK